MVFLEKKDNNRNHFLLITIKFIIHYIYILIDKKTIVFDLDETLIHCNESTDIPSDIILPI